jgi:hypothetical protein
MIGFSATRLHDARPAFGKRKATPRDKQAKLPASSGRMSDVQREAAHIGADLHHVRPHFWQPNPPKLNKKPKIELA